MLKGTQPESAQEHSSDHLNWKGKPEPQLVPGSQNLDTGPSKPWGQWGFAVVRNSLQSSCFTGDFHPGAGQLPRSLPGQTRAMGVGSNSRVCNTRQGVEMHPESRGEQWEGSQSPPSSRICHPQVPHCYQDLFLTAAQKQQNNHTVLNSALNQAQPSQSCSAIPSHTSHPSSFLAPQNKEPWE